LKENEKLSQTMKERYKLLAEHSDLVGGDEAGSPPPSLDTIEEEQKKEK
jgi:hypothetical protein